MKTMAIILMMIMSMSAFADVPRAYFSAVKKTVVVNGQEPTGTFPYYKIPGEFSDNAEAHALYQEYKSAAKWDALFMLGGAAILVFGVSNHNEWQMIGGGSSYLYGAYRTHKSGIKLHKIMNIYNGVPSSEALNFDIRDNCRYAGNYGLSWTFEF